MNATLSNLVEILTPVWERVLDSAPIDADANFFDLGGDSILALRLFTEISNVCGVQLPPVTIYEAPTIRALAALLERPENFRFPALTLLKEGKDEPPIFLTHGIGGNVMDFFQLVKHIRTTQPIYGLQSKGVNGIEEPHQRIEDMAQYFLEAIQTRQPHGPYYLIGYSLGGLVMLELAQTLVANGENVGLLVLLEAYPHRRYLSIEQNLRLFVRRAVRHATILFRLPKERVLNYIFHPAERLVFARNDFSRTNGLPLDLWFTPAMQKMRDRAYLGLKTYQPRFYPGSIKFLRAESVTDFPRDAAAVWSNLAKEFETVTVPGDHLEIINTNFASVGAALSRYLQQARQKEVDQSRTAR
ncbi:MAG TPA: alpha/beta fold hydrolase [Candidatus Sulfotelmatobacter sp.]|nr:alpha/beta fold hydrolase [Candidatus Sulfotelmatobacter sp.]